MSHKFPVCLCRVGRSIIYIRVYRASRENVIQPTYVIGVRMSSYKKSDLADAEPRQLTKG